MQWDTPATLGCVEELVTISNTSVLFGVECKERKKKFLLEFEAHGIFVPEVRPTPCTQTQSQG